MSKNQMAFGRIVRIVTSLVERRHPGATPRAQAENVARILNDSFAGGDFQFAKPAEARQLLRQLN